MLYVIGGRSGLAMGEGATNELHAFDTTSRTWTRLSPQGSQPPKRSYHAMTALGPKLYVFGGCGEDGRLNDLYEYDTRTNTWTALATPSPDAVPGRGGSCLAAVPPEAADGAAEGPAREGLLYVIGGFCGHELDDMHVYSIADNIWCRPTCPTCCGAANAAGELSARSVFGTSLHRCDKSDCSYKAAVLAYGGEVDPSDKGHAGAGDFCSSLMMYDKAGGWRLVEADGESPGPRGWFAAATGPAGQLIVHGGLDANNERLGDMFALDLHA
ncbi:hypothetical protein Agub_g2969 [Astrephomene gubernaculifera]|uniref:Uncharacterized protein n=1 Tax=Astrephomene gubernaculifera TaxID=47775 RepID=A0AAD3HIT2_9CHLO|nr:hypothetical protein Agub_g2969 [Astrephomene gubernaculifera]